MTRGLLPSNAAAAIAQSESTIPLALIYTVNTPEIDLAPVAIRQHHLRGNILDRLYSVDRPRDRNLEEKSTQSFLQV